MDAKRMADYLLSIADYAEGDIPIGWPAWWIGWIRSRPTVHRKAVHELALRYSGRSASDEAEVSGLSPSYVSRITRDPVFQRFLSELGAPLAEQAACVASKEEVLGFWTATMQDESLDASARLRASEGLAKAQGAWIERKEVEVKSESVIAIHPQDIADRIAALRSDEDFLTL